MTITERILEALRAADVGASLIAPDETEWIKQRSASGKGLHWTDGLDEQRNSAELASLLVTLGMKDPPRFGEQRPLEKLDYRAKNDALWREEQEEKTAAAPSAVEIPATTKNWPGRLKRNGQPDMRDVRNVDHRARLEVAAKARGSVRKEEVVPTKNQANPLDGKPPLQGGTGRKINWLERADWLRQQVADGVGDVAIARELGTSLTAVERARTVLGITRLAEGGFRPAKARVQAKDPKAVALVNSLGRERGISAARACALLIHAGAERLGVEVPRG